MNSSSGVAEQDGGGQIFVGVDLATASARVTCSSTSGVVLATADAPLPAPSRSDAGTSEQDAASWWPATRRALREATGKLGAARHRISALCISATSGTVALADRQGNPLGPALMYDDRRASAQAAAAQRAGAQRWRDLGLSISPSFSLAKVGWMAEHGLLKEPARICHASDLLLWQLAGEPTPTDWSHALKTGYDPLRCEWAVEALEALGVDTTRLPEVKPPTTVVGEVATAVAAATGLPAGTQLVLGMTDSCAAQLACGVAQTGQFVTVLGTTLVLKGVQEGLFLDPTGAVYSHRHPDGQWLPGGASNTGGEALSVFAHERYAELEAAAAARGPAETVRYPLMRAGERFPFVASGAHFFELGSPADEVEAFRSCLEGVAFLERLAYDHLRQMGMTITGPITSAGGGSRSRVWSKVRATVLGCTLRTVAHADTSFGACVLAAAGTAFPDVAAATAAMVQERSTVEPARGEAEALLLSYGRFVDGLATRGWIDSELAAIARQAPKLTAS